MKEAASEQTKESIKYIVSTYKTLCHFQKLDVRNIFVGNFLRCLFVYLYVICRTLICICMYMCVSLSVCVLFLMQIHLHISAANLKTSVGNVRWFPTNWGHVQNVPQTPQNAQSRGKPDTFFSLVTTTVISIHSCKVSRESFRFLKSLRNIPKIGPKVLHNVPSRGIRAAKFFLAHWLSE